MTTPIEQQRWWTLPAEEAHAAVFTSVRRIATQLAGRRMDDMLFMQMYGARDVIGRGEDVGGIGSDPRRHLKPENGLNKLKTNVVRSVVNTAAAHIASKRPASRFQTDDANWSLTRKAQACEQAVKGVYYQNDVYALGEEGFKDAGISSLGALYVYSEEGSVKIERVMSTEILVDIREGYYGAPRTMYRVKLAERIVLKEAYDLAELPGGTVDKDLIKLFSWLPWGDGHADQTVLVAAWRLGSNGKPGKHIVATQDKTLDFRDWTRKRFPFSFLRWEKRQAGFYGCGIVEELRGHQRAVNYLNARIADSMHINTRSNIVVFDAAQNKPSVNVQHINNDPSTIIRVRTGGQAPALLKHNATPEEWFAYRREIIEDAYAQIGVSQLQATGQIPQGIKSGVAIREVQDAGSKRWQTKMQAYDQWLGVDTAKLVIDELRDMAERDEVKPIPVKIRRGSLAAVEQIDWKEVALEDHEYTLEVSPASSLPDTTAGRRQTIEDWFAAGFIDRTQVMALQDAPDLERYRSLELASYEIILDTIERIVEDGEYFPPEPTDDVELAIRLATQSYNKFRLRRLPQENLDLILQYLDDLRAMKEAATAPAAMTQAPPGTEQAAPAAPPTTGAPAIGAGPQAALAAA